MNFQLMPSDDHRRNLEEKAIKTLKDHFIGIMCGTAVALPVQIWWQAITQAQQELLLLRKSNVNTKVSEYSQVYGPHDHNAVPFFPIVMETLVHDNPKRMGMFAENCSNGYVLGTDFDH